MLIDILTHTASLRTRVEAVDLDYLRPVLRGHMLKLLDKCAKGKVIHLPPPKTCHAQKAQVLDADSRVPTAHLMACLPLPIVTTVANALVATIQVHSPHLTMIGAFLATGQGPGLAAELIQARLEELRVLNPRSVGEGQIRLQAEVHTHGCTFE